MIKSELGGSVRKASASAWLQVISKVVEGSMLGRMRNTELTDEQWESLAPLLPPRRLRGRPRADDRKTLNGILYVLRTGCRWEDVPREYGSPTTCWRRLKAWEGDGTWEKVWCGLLALLDERDDLEWERAFLDGSIIPAKKGARGWEDEAGQGHQANADYGRQRPADRLRVGGRQPPRGETGR